MVKLFDEAACAATREPEAGGAPPAAGPMAVGSRNSCVVPVCSPTRSCFLSGRVRGRAG